MHASIDSYIPSMHTSNHACSPMAAAVVARSVVISNHPAGDTGYLRFRAPEAYVPWQILAQRRLARGGGANHWVYHRKTMGKP